MRKAILVLICFFLGFMSCWLIREYFLFDPVALFDDQYTTKVVELINNARESVYVIMFEMKYYNTTNQATRLINALIRAKARGVDVKVLLESGAEWNNIEAFHNVTRAYLSYYNVSVKFDDTNTTTHAKVLIIDHEIVIVGSTNWVYYSLTKNHEANVIIKDPILARKFEQYFFDLWSK